MDKKVIAALVNNGARWANNVIVELLGNYGSKIDDDSRKALATASSALSSIYVHVEE